MDLKNTLAALALSLGLLGSGVTAQQQPKKQEVKVLSMEEKLVKTQSKIIETDSSFSVQVVAEKKIIYHTDKGKIASPFNVYLTQWNYNKCNDKPKYAPMTGNHMHYAFVLQTWPRLTQVVEFHDFNCDHKPDVIRSSGANVVPEDKFGELYLENFGLILKCEKDILQKAKAWSKKHSKNR